MAIASARDSAVLAYRKLIQVASSLQSVFLLAVRLYWGWQFFLSGKGKLMHLDKTAEFFASLNIPAPNAALLAGSTECFGGLLLLIGLGSRLVSIPLAFTMVIAYLTDERGDRSISTFIGDIFREPDKIVTAAPFLFLMASLIVLIFGPGKASVDHFLAKFWTRQVPLATQIRESHGASAK